MTAIAGRLGEYPGSNRNNQTGILSNRSEVGRADQFVFPTPANQGLKPTRNHHAIWRNYFDSKTGCHSKMGKQMDEKAVPGNMEFALRMATYRIEASKETGKAG
jgi:hypothetical protein